MVAVGGVEVMRPAYFVVYRVLGREVPAIFWDELPKEPVRQMIYVTRLDELPNGAALVEQRLSVLYRVFCDLRQAGKLPPRWEPPARTPADDAKMLAGVLIRLLPMATTPRHRINPRIHSRIGPARLSY